LVPIGVTGELYIGGTGLARGYWRREPLTAERFVSSPFISGERLYRSGDLVRWRATGVLEFLGRLDDQVKVRGFRVEPGEIEAVLTRHPAVRAVAVVSSRDRDRSTRLVAYVALGPLALDEGHATGVTTSAAVGSTLRAYLLETLPEYMIPAAVVVLDQMPLTASGKVDRVALASRHEVPHDRDVPIVAPRNEVEAMLADIWAQLLQVDCIGVFDNFFELGGHSLLGTQLISRLRAAFRIELPLRRLFDSPTIAGLAAAIEQERLAPGGPDPGIVPISAPQLLDQLSDQEVDAMLRGMLGDDV
jgi:acyl carrier protein